MDLRGDLPRIGAPTLVVSATDDSATPPEHQELIAAAIPASRLVSLPGAAHQAAVEQPAAAARLILDHLQDAP
jgi:pimeloyl-ACP methyl ester carboxylesterase